MNLKHIALLILIFLVVSPVVATTEPNFVRQGTIASAQSSPGYIAWNAIDRKPATDWWSGGSAYPIWYQFDYGSGNTSYIESYEMTHYAGTGYYWDTWVVQGTNNNASWSAILDYRTGETFGASTSKKYFFRPEYAANKSDYRFYRILGFKGTNDPQFTEFYLYNEGNSSVDTTPPASITNLQNTTPCENVTFTWTNPFDSDYSHLYNLWDNVPGTNLTNITTSKAFTPATVGTHTFSTKTVDLKGNINGTWVNMSIIITACPTPTPTPTPSTTATTAVPSVSCTLPTTPPWCAHQDIFMHGVYGDIAGYRVMNNLPERNDTKTIVSQSISSSSGEKTLATWLTPAFSSTETKILAPGLWTFHSYASATSDAGTTQLKYRVFNRSSTGTITWLFFGQAFSKDINPALVPTHYDTDYARRNYTTFFPGDRLGVQINVSTDSAAERTVSYDVSGNTNASAVTVGYFLCSSCSYGATTATASGASLPYVVNPTTDKKTDWLKLIWEWWWLPALILFMIWLFGGRR